MLAALTNEIIIQNTEAMPNPGLDFQAVTMDETKSACNAMPEIPEHEQERRKECNTQQLVATSLINDASNDHERLKNLTSHGEPLDKKNMERSFAIIAKETGDFSRHSTDETNYGSPFLPPSDMKEFGHKMRDFNSNYGRTDVENESYAFGSEVFDENSPCLFPEEKHDSSVNGFPVLAFVSQQEIVDLYQGTISTSRLKSCSSFGSQVEIDMQGVIQIPFRQNSTSSTFIREANPANIFPFFTEDSEDEVFSDVEFSRDDPFQQMTPLESELADTKCKSSGICAGNCAYFEQLQSEDNNVTSRDQKCVKVTDLDALFMLQETNLDDNELENENEMEEKIEDECEKEETSSNDCGEFSEIPITPRKTKRTSNLSRLSVNLDGSFFFEVEDVIIPQESSPKKLNIANLFMEDCAGEEEIIPVILVKKKELLRDYCVHERVTSDQVEDVRCSDTNDIWNVFDSRDDQTDSAGFALQTMPANDDKNDFYGLNENQAGFDSAVGGSGGDNTTNQEDGFSVDIPDGVDDEVDRNVQDCRVVEDVCEVVEGNLCDKEVGCSVDEYYVRERRTGDDFRHVVEDNAGDENAGVGKDDVDSIIIEIMSDRNSVVSGDGGVGEDDVDSILIDIMGDSNNAVSGDGGVGEDDVDVDSILIEIMDDSNNVVSGDGGVEENVDDHVVEDGGNDDNDDGLRGGGEDVYGNINSEDVGVSEKGDDRICKDGRDDDDDTVNDDDTLKDDDTVNDDDTLNDDDTVNDDDRLREVAEDICFVEENTGGVDNADDGHDADIVNGNDDGHCGVAEDVCIAGKNGHGVAEDGNTCHRVDETNDDDNVTEQGNMFHDDNAETFSTVDNEDHSTAAIDEQEDFVCVVTIDAEEDKRTDNISHNEDEDGIADDMIVYVDVNEDGDDSKHGRASTDVVCYLEDDEKFTCADDERFTCADDNDENDNDVKQRGDIDNSANDTAAEEINNKLTCAAADDEADDDDVKHDGNVANSTKVTGVGEINADNVDEQLVYGDNNDTNVVDDINNVKDNDNDTRNSDVTIPDEDDNGIIIDSANTTDDMIIYDADNNDTNESSIANVVNSNQGVLSDDVNVDGKQADASSLLKRNLTEPLDEKTPVKSTGNLPKKDLQHEKVADGFKTSTKQKSRKKDRLPKEARKSKSTKSTKKSLGKKSSRSRSSKGERGPIEESLGHESRNSEKGISLDERIPKSIRESLESYSTGARSSNSEFSLDERNPRSTRESLGNYSAPAPSSNSELSLNERITNVNRSIDWVRKVLMEMRAQDLNLKIQFDGLRQEIRNLKQEYDEYVNCEYYDEEELRNIELLNYKTKDKKLRHVTGNALREDSGYHSDTSSVSDSKEPEKSKGTRFQGTKAKYIYQPVPSFPKVQTLKSSNCVFELVL